MLGDLESECEPGESIQAVCALAPKTYSYITTHGKVVHKCKGITLHAGALNTINTELYKAMAFGENVSVEVTQTKFIVDGKHNTVHTNEAFKKTFRIHPETKRYVQSVEPHLITTLPWGYEKE